MSLGEGRRRDARDLLSFYEPSSEAEAVHLRRIRALLDHEGDVLSRAHFDPGHLTASAVLVDPDRRRMILIEHAKLARWLQPGGHIEPDDASLADAALREAREEVAGVDIRMVGLFDVDVHDIPATGTEPAHAHFDVRFLCEVTAGEPTPGDGALDARWVTANDLAHVVTGDSIERLFAKALG